MMARFSLKLWKKLIGLCLKLRMNFHALVLFVNVVKTGVGAGTPSCALCVFTFKDLDVSLFETDLADVLHRYTVIYIHIF